MSFPVSPVNNQTAIVNGITYIYNSTNGTWTRQTIALTGTVVTYNISPPASGSTPGDRWIDSNDGTQYTYIFDGSTYQWVDFSVPTVNTYSILGGSAGAIPYQLSASNTSFINAGSQGQVLSITSGATPIWVSQSSFSIANTQITGLITSGQIATVANTQITGVMTASQLAATAVTTGTYGGSTAIPVITVDQQGRLTSAANVSVSTGITITDDISTATALYPTFTSATSGSISGEKVSSTGLTFVPSTGTLSATVVTATSDENLKDNIVTITNAVDTVKKLRGVEYDWKNNGQHSMGVVAQELEKVLPYLVHENENGKSVMYSNIIGLLIEAIKEQQIQIDELKGMINGNHD